MKQENQIKPKAQIYFSGHSKNHQALYDTKNDVMFINTGAASVSQKRMKKHSLEIFYSEEPGFVFVKAFSTKLEISFVNVNGTVMTKLIKEIN